MLPVERKNEFLRYVMITKPYDEWLSVVYGYIIDNNIKNWKEGFDFVINYSDNPSWVAYHMVKDGDVEPEWGRKVIENDAICNSSWFAYRMVSGGYAEPKWGRKVIENDTIGGPLRAAYFMVKYGFATQEWFEEIKRKNNVPR